MLKESQPLAFKATYSLSRRLKLFNCDSVLISNFFWASFSLVVKVMTSFASILVDFVCLHVPQLSTFQQNNWLRTFSMVVSMRKKEKAANMQFYHDPCMLFIHINKNNDISMWLPAFFLQ